MKGKQDGGLRAMMIKSLPTFHWVPVETWALVQGVPDLEYCAPNGVSGWIECKSYSQNGKKPELRPAQIGWIERRLRHNGRVFIFVKHGQSIKYCPGHLCRNFLVNLSEPLDWATIEKILTQNSVSGE